MDDENDFLFGAPWRLMSDVLWLVRSVGTIEDGCQPGAVAQLEEAISRSEDDLVRIPVSLAKHLGLQLEKAHRRGDFDHLGEQAESMLRFELEVAVCFDRPLRMPIRPTAWSDEGRLPRWFADEVVARGVAVKNPELLGAIRA